MRVRPVPPAVEPVPAVHPVAATAPRARQDRDHSATAEAGPGAGAAQSLTPPPEPVSTQSVLLLRQKGASTAGIAEAYGMSVDAVRRLLHPDRRQDVQRGAAGGDVDRRQ